MVRQTPDRNEDPSSEELSPRLREAIGRIVDVPPPKELLDRSLQRAQRSSAQPVRRRRRQVAVWVALAAAACVSGVAYLGSLDRSGDPTAEIKDDPDSPSDTPSPDVPRHELRSSPTLWAYHRAAQQSPEALAELLDEHADQMATTGPDSFPIGIFFGTREETL